MLLDMLGLSPERAIIVLSIPLMVDFPRTMAKILVLAFARFIGSSKHRSGGYEPLVSIIVPAHNEQDVIDRSIASLLELDYPRMEIIVVDDASTDNTYQRLMKYLNHSQVKVVRRNTKSGSKAKAVNHGLAFAKGEVIVTVDADTLIERDALKKAVKALADPHVIAAAGNVKVLDQKGFLSRMQSYEYMLSMEMGRRYHSALGTLLIISGAFGLFKREFLSSVGSYDTDTITEDFDITFKMLKTGKRIVFVSEAVAWTAVPQRLTEWSRQRIRWTLGQLQTLRKHRNLLFSRRFGVVGLLAGPDMVFMDLSLLILRTAWLMSIPFYYFDSLPGVFVIMMGFYLFNEFLTGAVGSLLSFSKKNFLNLLMVPAIVLVYRPFYAFVRLQAYFSNLMGLTTRW